MKHSKRIKDVFETFKTYKRRLEGILSLKKIGVSKNIFLFSKPTFIEFTNVGFLCVAEMVVPTARSNNGVRAARIRIRLIA